MPTGIAQKLQPSLPRYSIEAESFGEKDELSLHTSVDPQFGHATVSSTTIFTGFSNLWPHFAQEYSYIGIIDLPDETYCNSNIINKQCVVNGSYHSIPVKNFALLVFNGDSMCFIHVLLNANDKKLGRGIEGCVPVESAFSPFSSCTRPADSVDQFAVAVVICFLAKVVDVDIDDVGEPAEFVCCPDVVGDGIPGEFSVAEGKGAPL